MQLIRFHLLIDNIERRILYYILILFKMLNYMVSGNKQNIGNVILLDFIIIIIVDSAILL